MNHRCLYSSFSEIRNSRRFALSLRIHAGRPCPSNSTVRLQKAGSRHLHQTVAQAVQAPVAAPVAAVAAPVLLTKLVKAGAAGITCALVLKDNCEKCVVTASLDKTLLRVRLNETVSGSRNGQSNGNGSSNGNGASPVGSFCSMNSMDDISSMPPPPAAPPGSRHLHLTRLQAPGGPAFAIARQPQPATGSVFDASSEVVYVGNASKELVAWEVQPDFSVEEVGSAQFQTVATNYTGWVRSLALSGKWLFSCGCNHLLVHDTSHPIPEKVAHETLFKGDIQAISVTSSEVYVATSDGFLRMWRIKKTGQLVPVKEVANAHSGRISGLAVHGSTLYSCGHDGWLKAWDGDSLQLLAAVPDAHHGAKVHALAIGPDGLLYSGGDDKLIRSWKPLSPALDFLAKLDHIEGQVAPHPLVPLPPVGEPLVGHEASVKVLAAGSSELLVSGDSEGDVCIWALQKHQH